MEGLRAFFAKRGASQAKRVAMLQEKTPSEHPAQQPALATDE
jgi:hypothetical protein